MQPGPDAAQHEVDDYQVAFVWPWISLDIYAWPPHPGVQREMERSRGSRQTLKRQQEKTLFWTLQCSVVQQQTKWWKIHHIKLQPNHNCWVECVQTHSLFPLSNYPEMGEDLWNINMTFWWLPGLYFPLSVLHLQHWESGDEDVQTQRRKVTNKVYKATEDRGRGAKNSRWRDVNKGNR